MHLKHSKKTIVKCAAVIFGVLIIPLTYSYFYLDAFWNPYNSLDKLPVAVVNQDKGALVNGKSRNLGGEMVGRMKSSDSLKWVFTDSETAQSGVEGKKYYAEIVIPADFSKSIASASTADKTPAKIYYSANEKRNYLAAQILSRAVVQLEEETRSTVDRELTAQLTDKLSDVPKNLSTLDDGLTKLSSGASTLNTSVGALLAGQNKVSGGAASLRGGLSTLAAGASSLDNGLGTLSSSASQLSAGAGKLDTSIGSLSDGAKSLLAQVQPGSDFRNGLSGLKDGLGQLKAQFATDPTGNGGTAYDQFNAQANNYATLTDGMVYSLAATQYSALYGSYYKANYAATGSAQSAASYAAANAASSFGSIISDSASGLRAAAGNALHTFLATPQTSSGYNDAYQGAIGYINLYDVYNSYYTNVLGAVSAGKLSATDQNAQKAAFVFAMKSNASSYTATDYQNFVTAIGQTMTAQQSAAAAQMIGGANQNNVVAAGDNFTSGVDTQLFGALAANTQKLYDGSQKLSDGASAISDGVSTMTGAIGQIKDGSSQLASGASALAKGAADAKTGSALLASGAASANAGASQLTDGTAQVGDGISRLSDGTALLASGLGEAESGVKDSIGTANDELKTTQGLDSYAEKPVTIEKNAINPVPDYGTAFAPYFLSLSLWVGALIIMVGIYLDPKEKFKSLSMNSDRRIFRTLIFAIISIGQSLLLAAVVMFGLKLQVKDIPAYYAACVLIGFTSMSIVQFLIVNLQDVGKFLSIILLILQLTSCGGTFPMETVPKIFNVLYPYMPMTYAVGLFKEVISGLNAADAWHNTFVLCSIMGVFLCINMLFSATRKVKERMQVRLNAEADED